jgi:transposase
LTTFNRSLDRHAPRRRRLPGLEPDAGPELHLIVDNYATHKHPKVRTWLQRHKRFHFHFIPTSASWLNAVEGFFAKLTLQRLQRRVQRHRRSPGGQTTSTSSKPTTIQTLHLNRTL